MEKKKHYKNVYQAIQLGKHEREHRLTISLNLPHSKHFQLVYEKPYYQKESLLCLISDIITRQSFSRIRFCILIFAHIYNPLNMARISMVKGSRTSSSFLLAANTTFLLESLRMILTPAFFQSYPIDRMILQYFRSRRLQAYLIISPLHKVLQLQTA